MIPIKPPPCRGQACQRYQTGRPHLSLPTPPPPTYHGHLHLLASCALTCTRMQPAVPVVLRPCLLRAPLPARTTPALPKPPVLSSHFTQASIPGMQNGKHLQVHASGEVHQDRLVGRDWLHPRAPLSSYGICFARLKCIAPLFWHQD